MSIPPEIEAAITARVAAMGHKERYDRAAAMIDIPEPRDEDEVEFAKLILGPQASTKELAAMLQLND